MYQQFTYEEARHHDAHRAAHASDPTWSDFRRRRPIRRWFVAMRDRYRIEIIDLRSPVPDMPRIQHQRLPSPGELSEFVDVDIVSRTEPAPAPSKVPAQS
jgi:hypothetical protein